MKYVLKVIEKIPKINQEKVVVKKKQPRVINPNPHLSNTMLEDDVDVDAVQTSLARSQPLVDGVHVTVVKQSTYCKTEEKKL